jgi:hypothetical protein
MTRQRRWWATWRVCAASGVLLMGSSAYPQWQEGSQAARDSREPDQDARDQQLKQDEQAQQGLQKAAMAEAIMAREEAVSGRPFDPAFRARIKADLALRSFEEMAEVQNRGQGLLPGPRNLGDSQADLVYTPVVPCRIIDTRFAGGKIPAGGTRSFRVTGVNFSSQGGTSGDCQVPVGPATAAVINFVAVAPDGAGDFRITPFATAMPSASFLNYALVTGLNIANGMAFAICNPATTTCTDDFTIQADVSAAHVVADVQGYFRNLRTEQVKSFVVTDTGTGASTSGSCTNATGLSATVTAPVAGTIVLNAGATVQVGHTNGATTETDFWWGTSATACTTTAGYVGMTAGAATAVYYHRFAATRSFAVGAGATVTYFLNTQQFGGTGLAGGTPVLTATFIPN